MLTPENSGSYFFDTHPTANVTGKLSHHGVMAQTVHRLISSHDRGVPYIPLLVVIDEASGYSRIPCNYGASAWGIFTGNYQASETKGLNETDVPVSILVDLFEGQIWPDKGRGATLERIEESQLRPTPYGEIVDVGLSDSPGEYMAAYHLILLAGGDIDFNKPSSIAGTSGTTSLAQELLIALKSPSQPRLLLQQYHVNSLVALGRFDALNSTGRVEVLSRWINPVTKVGSAISNTRLEEISQEFLPVTVTANVSVQYQVNRVAANAEDTLEDRLEDGTPPYITARRWIIEILNNDGITKPINGTSIIDYAMTSNVTVKPKFSFKKVMQWGLEGDKQIRGAGGTSSTSIQLLLPPGGIAYLEFVLV